MDNNIIIVVNLPAEQQHDDDNQFSRPAIGSKIKMAKAGPMNPTPLYISL